MERPCPICGTTLTEADTLPCDLAHGACPVGEMNMTPAEFEWADEQTELAYKRGEIGRITFHRRMSALGFSTKAIKEMLAEIDARKAQ